jgi:DNA-binding transcriptional ArsR family regulator
MAIKYRDISGEEKLVRSHTGLKRSEFEALAEKFKVEWQHYMRHFTWEGKQRVRQGKVRKNSVLTTIEDKLFFVLYYLKLNPLQDALASSFGLDQPQASRWLELLRARLLATLSQEKVLPQRKTERLYRILETETKLIIDATERQVGRSVDDETQKEYYSGKKKPYH